MSVARYFVFHCDGEWTVALDGAPLGRHASRPAALNSAIVMADLMGAMQHESDVMLEADGQLQICWTYGVDPVPTLASEAA